MSAPGDGAADALSPPDWTEDGAFRAAYLAHYPEEDRAVLRQAGEILAGQVFTAEGTRSPGVVGLFRAALEDARSLTVFLREIADKGKDRLPTEADRLLAKEAEHWWRAASDLRNGMAASFQDATGEWIEGEGTS